MVRGPKAEDNTVEGAQEGLLFYRCPGGALGIKWEKVERAGL